MKICLARNLNGIFLAAICALLAQPAAATPQLIQPGAIWPDNRGQHVQAHGGGIIKIGDTW